MSSILKVNTIQDTDGNNIINENANTITIGASGDTITIPSGATLANNGTATGFASIEWQAVKTSNFTASAAQGIFADTSSGGWTLTLPAGSSGATVEVVDYAGTFGTNNLTIATNGSEKIEGSTDNKILATNRQGIQLVYADSTQGWLVPVARFDNPFFVAPYDISFLVVAGGAGAGIDLCGGGGAGGFRTSTQSSVAGGSEIVVAVGDGGSGGTSNSTRENTSGSDSSVTAVAITNITSAGGGAGGVYSYPSASPRAGLDGGSGGGGGGQDSAGGPGGSGNTPATTPSQGNNGANGTSGSPYAGGGGGGANASGSGANGGNGSASTITGSSVTYAGGGGGTGYGVDGTGGTGGGGTGPHSGSTGGSGTANLGGGGGAAGTSPGTGGSGGKGVVIISVPTANYSANTTGSPTVTTSGSNTIMTFNGDGSYTT